MANQPSIGGLSVGGGLLGGGRLNIPGTTPTGAKTSKPSITSAAAKTSTTVTKPTTPTTPSSFNLAASTKLASFIRPELTKKMDPNILTISPGILTAFLEKTTTQLARGAIKQLETVNTTLRNEAINTITNRGISPGRLMSHLERRVRIGEVLNELAKDWDPETQQDFAEALNMDVKKQDIMDTIVSLAILNDQDLEDELRLENLSDPTEDELLSNRRIVWQYPPPGTPLNPPYMVFVAVEHQEFAKAQEVIDSILGQLVMHEGFKVPKTTVSKPMLPMGRTMALRSPS